MIKKKQKKQISKRTIFVSARKKTSRTLKPSLKKIKTPFPSKKLAEFRKLLIRIKEHMRGNLSKMEEETLSQSRRDASGDLSNMPIHIADAGSDTYEQDFNLGLIENEGEEIQEIDAALDRIGEGIYGLCERCTQPISEKRLKAIPYSRLCIKCKEKEEVGL